jgi:hypothetical protein
VSWKNAEACGSASMSAGARFCRALIVTASASIFSARRVTARLAKVVAKSARRAVSSASRSRQSFRRVSHSAARALSALSNLARCSQ